VKKTINQQKVVLLDRDGVINRDSPAYIKSWDEFEFLPGSLEALKLLHQDGFTTIIITNQSAIGRGMITSEILEGMHRRMSETVRSHGGRIEDIFYCPHRPDEGCDCRKPKTGLIDQARKKYSLILSGAMMVGDSAKDIECARNAGCRAAILVKTGNGRQAENQLRERKIPIDYLAEDLLDAVNWIISEEKRDK
jgi:D-glycero-D-manno-heptose 1,7-bisphosphate phosphatase